MSSRQPGSELTLGRLAAEACTGARAARLLIGGLGLGFTLRGALDALPGDAKVVVAELLAPVVEWNRTRVAELAGRPLEDPRVEVRLGDVFEVVRAGGAQAWHAIALDVDNGPSFFCLDRNARIYDAAGLACLGEGLRAGGLLAIWSSYEDPSFLRALRRTGFVAEARAVRSRGRKGLRHTIFLARKPGRARGSRGERPRTSRSR